MKINFDQPFINIESGKPIPRLGPGSDVDGEGGLFFCLKDAAITVLLAFDPEREKIDGIEKASRYDLAMAIYHAMEGPLEMEIPQINKIRKLIGEMYGPLIVGQAWQMLDHADQKILKR